MIAPPRAAMLLAAGLGTRMRPLTDRTAKPLLPLGGRPLIDHALDRLTESGVETVVVNTHWHGERVAAHLAERERHGLPPRCLPRAEPVLLDTGGAVAAALAEEHLPPDSFFIVNGDAFWLNGPRPALRRLAAFFDPVDMDAVLLVQRTASVIADVGDGDFALDPWGRPRRPREREIVPYVYAGVQIAAGRLFADAPAGPFSLNRQWNRAMAAGRLRAVVHDGLWFHLSTPADLAHAESVLQVRAAAGSR